MSVECEENDCYDEAEVEIVLYMAGDDIIEDKHLCINHALPYLLKKKLEFIDKKVKEQDGIKKDLSSLHKIAAKIGKVSCVGIR